MLPELRFPNNIDENNLFKAYDSLKTSLTKDYNPGDGRIYAENTTIFPDKGIISVIDGTITTSYYYGEKTEEYFTDLRILDKDSSKSHKTSIILQQIRAEYHNRIKDSIIKIQNTLGTLNDTKDSIFGRINNLKTVVFTPKAWFSADVTKGIAPLHVVFTSESLGVDGPTGQILYSWDFQDEKLDSYEPSIDKMFVDPGEYTVSLTVTNDYGEDTVTFHKMIKVMAEAPKEASLVFTPQRGQIPGEPLRTNINTPVKVETTETKNIKKFKWSINEDNSPQTELSYDKGGIYDIVLRTETREGSYRISKFPNQIDVVEDVNLWLWTKNDNTITSYEFGLFSETFKIRPKYNIGGGDKPGFSRRNTMSGRQGTCLLHWQNEENINFVEYNGFTGDYFKAHSLERKGNWVSFTINNNLYFALGENNKVTINLSNYRTEEDQFYAYHYLNGAEDITRSGIYKATSDANSAYITKNYTSFYKTEGTIAYPFINLTKLPDIPGNKTNGALVNINGNIYLFDGTEALYSYSYIRGTWEMTSVPEFRLNKPESIVACSDNQNYAYVAFDNKFFKFNEINKTYTPLNGLPVNSWLMGIY